MSAATLRQIGSNCGRHTSPGRARCAPDRRRRPEGAVFRLVGRYRGGVTPSDDASGPDFGPLAPAGHPPLSMEERAGVLDDLAELEVFRTLLEPTGIKGIVVDCPDCNEEHHVDWALM